MYVCLCNAISDSDIRDAVHKGVDDIETLQEELGAGTVCGSCREYTEHLISETKANTLSYAV